MCKSGQNHVLGKQLVLVKRPEGLAAMAYPASWLGMCRRRRLGAVGYRIDEVEL